ncbi:hypothetical protein TNCV_695011 [Trichonephila clavipes]|nr:hypothetical protein TNCV_695011 [Trichonephila clavipes]
MFLLLSKDPQQRVLWKSTPKENCEGITGDGPRHFEQWSSDEDNTSAGNFSPSFHTTPMGGRLGLDILMHRPPLHGGYSAVLDSNS